MTETSTKTPTVGDAMLRHPTIHTADLTVGEAYDIFARHPKTHLLLLVRDGVLVSTLARADLETPQAQAADRDAPAMHLGSLAHRTTAPGMLLAPTREEMIEHGQRRVAVVDPDMHLLGLLCLKRKLTDFCTDEGVAAMRAERRANGLPEQPSHPET